MEPVARLRNHAGTTVGKVEIRRERDASDVVRDSGQPAVTSAGRHDAAMRSALDRFLSIGPRTALAVSIAVLAVPLVFVLVTPHPLDQRVGVDYELYRDVTSRWLDGGTFFETHQLAGASEITPGDVLYPPVAIWLFGPWALAATGGGPGPAVVAALWWAIPLGATIAAVAALQPRPWAWPLLTQNAAQRSHLFSSRAAA